MNKLQDFSAEFEGDMQMQQSRILDPEPFYV